MMDAVYDLLVDVLYVGGAIAAIILALWLASQRPGPSRIVNPMVIALGITALWGLAAFGLSPTGPLTMGLVSLSYLGWLALLYGLFATDLRDRSVSPIRPVFLSLALLEIMQLVLFAVRLNYADEPSAQELITPLSIMFRLMSCTGALVLVHNLYAGAAQQSRQILRWPAAALATMWLYDLNLSTVAYLSEEPPVFLTEMRSLAMVAVVTLLALGTVRSETNLRFQPSRSFAFRSFSLLVIGAYLVVMVVVAQAIAYAGNEFARYIQVGFVLLASALALAFLPSKKMRGWLRVTIAKNLFQHRYDYRAEWLRFTETIGRAGPQAAPLHERAVQAVADITDSPSGLLLTPREEGGLALDARWQWPRIEIPAIAIDQKGMSFFEKSEFILDLDDIRAGRTQGIPESATPEWLLSNEAAWAMVPLLHYEKLVGVVVLARPPVARLLDWEDFDLLRVVGLQLASYLAERTSQDALSEAQRFDEFNRRMAFVMHDIKNLASQLSLLARNAEKHADKPEFREDMIITLRNSTDKLQALLERLGRYGGGGTAGNKQVALDQVIARVVQQYSGKYEIVAPERDACTIMGDDEALEQALLHLVQNAIDASETTAPVFLDMRVHNGHAIVEVVDSGCGMSPEFVRTTLFKPFHSTKAGGFGIGAFEARELIRAMGGRLDVESREGVGTRFLIRFPLAETRELLSALGGDAERNPPKDNPEVA